MFYFSLRTLFAVSLIIQFSESPCVWSTPTAAIHQQDLTANPTATSVMYHDSPTWQLPQRSVKGERRGGGLGRTEIFPACKRLRQKPWLPVQLCGLVRERESATQSQRSASSSMPVSHNLCDRSVTVPSSFYPPGFKSMPVSDHFKLFKSFFSLEIYLTYKIDS